MIYQRNTLAEFSRAVGAIYAYSGRPSQGADPSTTRIHDPSLPPEELAFLDRLLETHRNAARHPPVLTPTASRQEVRDAPRYEGTGLTRREREILGWIAEGKRNAEIAGIVACSARTVSKHVEHILEKLRAETRLAAVEAANDLSRRGARIR